MLHCLNICKLLQTLSFAKSSAPETKIKVSWEIHSALFKNTNAKKLQTKKLQVLWH